MQLLWDSETLHRPKYTSQRPRPRKIESEGETQINSAIKDGKFAGERNQELHE